MEGQNEQKTEKNPKEEPLCEECKANPSKYKCPGCCLRSCSLACVKSHKQRTGCSGKRNQTQFIPLSHFDDNTLISDYNLLEEMKRVAESAQRTRAKLCGYPSYRLPFHLKSLRNAAASRRTKLLFLPSGMSKREKNKSRYDQRKKFISWTIEWRFHGTDVFILDNGVHEETSLCIVLKNHLEPGPWKNQLKQFCDVQLDSLKFFIRKYPKGPRSPFCQLDVKAPLKQQLANVVILEYPVIHVFLPSHSYDFEVIREEPVTTQPKPKDTVSNCYHNQKGVTFKEEEIHGDNSDPKIVDLRKHANSSHMHQNPTQNLTGKSASDSFDRPSLPNTTASCNSQSGFKIEELDLSEEMDFDFDQGLIDAYSDLIAQINPDDFLDLEGELAKQLEDGRDVSSSRRIPVVEELEEGEILE